MSRWGIFAIALSSAVPVGCAPATAGPAQVPSTPGAYPMESAGGLQPGRAVQREPGWRPAGDAFGTLGLDASIGNVLAALPAIGQPVPMGSISWPGAVHLSSVGDAGFTVSGEWIEVKRLAPELECEARGDPIRARVVVEVSDAGEQVQVESFFEPQAATECVVSQLGTRRLQRAAMDVYLWVRRLAREGTVVPEAV